MRRLRSSLLILALWTAGCAKVGDPLPPLADTPPPIAELNVVQVGERIELRFPAPPGPVESVEAYSQCQDPAAAAEASQPFARRELHQLRASDGTLTLSDSPQLNRTCRYAIRLVNRRGGRSPFSNFVEIDLAPTANAPTRLTHQVRPDRIMLSWEPPSRNTDDSRPARVVGYLVNSRHFVVEPEYQDVEIQFGQPSSYVVQSVGRQGNPLILSPPSDRLTVVPKDEFPPQTPANIRIIGLQGEIRLLWDANREPDLQGYVVYRGTEPEDLTRTSRLIQVNSYTDGPLVTGRIYYYRVAAVDQSGNESPTSESFSITVK